MVAQSAPQISGSLRASNIFQSSYDFINKIENFVEVTDDLVEVVHCTRTITPYTAEQTFESLFQRWFSLLDLHELIGGRSKI